MAENKQRIGGDIVDGVTGAALLMHSLAAAGLESKEVDGHQHVIIPPGYEFKDITGLVEKAQMIPYRKRGHMVLKDLDSLISYCNDQASSQTGAIYADPDSRTITAVFDDNRIDPGWRDHRASFKADYSLEFGKWINSNGKPMAQTEFAEFIEDNMADIMEPTASTLVEVAGTLQAKTEINFLSSKRLDNGQAQLLYNETINATAGAGGALAIPREFYLGLRLFKTGPGYRLKARLKYRLISGGVRFWYELDRPERVIEDAFTDFVVKLTEKTGYLVLIGVP